MLDFSHLRHLSTLHFLLLMNVLANIQTLIVMVRHFKSVQWMSSQFWLLF